MFILTFIPDQIRVLLVVKKERIGAGASNQQSQAHEVADFVRDIAEARPPTMVNASFHLLMDYFDLDSK